MVKLPFLAFLLVVVFAAVTSAQLRGPEGAVCTRQASRQVMYTVENRKKREPTSGVWDYLRIWDVFGIKKTRNPRSLVTYYDTEFYTVYECCVGWNRIGDTCQADCHFSCHHGLCVKTNLCECDEGWEGAQCEDDADECWYMIDECDHENGGCTNTEGSYQCFCNEGLHLFNNTCREKPDIDECATDNGGCEQNCHNTHGSYFCTCDAGYNLAADSHNCTDINECATDNGGCEHHCTNVPGGRNCSCRSNHRLVGEQICRDDDMYPYGEEAAEDPRRWNFTDCTEESLPPEGFRFFGRRHHKIHVCDNGIVGFDPIKRPRNPTLIQENFNWRKAAVLVPFLARSNPTLLDDLDEDLRTKIYYSFYEKDDGNPVSDEVLQRARNDGRSTPGFYSPDYDPVWAFVVTWTRVPPDCGMYRNGICPRDHDQLPVNDFQLAISTDGTNSYATFVYPTLKLQWVSTDEAKAGGTRKYPKSDGTIAVGGYSAGDGTGNYPFTPSTNASLVYRNKDFSGQDTRRTRIGRVVVSMRNLYRISGGNWKFALQHQADTAVPEPAVASCSQWIRQQAVEDPTQLLGYSFLPEVFSCPCTAEQAFYDTTYTVRSSQFGQSRFCAKSRRRVHTMVGSEKYIMSRGCCYSSAYWWTERTTSGRWRGRRSRIGGGSLLTGHAGGHLIINDEAVDEAAYQSCCVGASSIRNGWYCQRFQTLRPLSAPSSPACRQYAVTIGWTWTRPPPRAWFRYDPHFTTLDGISYTYNGLGEYVIADVDNGLYQVQGRTVLARGSSHATVISAIVVQEREKLPIQTNLVGNSSLGLYINGSVTSTVVFDDEDYEIEVGDNAIIVKPSNDSLLVVFFSGITVKITAKKGMLAVEFSPPPEFQGKVRGLLGRWDGDPANDFETFDGAVLPADSTERDLLAFGNSWQVTAEDGPKKSLFFYNPGEDVNSFVSADYQPKFTDEIIFNNTELEAAARDICGNDTECLFDVSQTGDIDVAVITVEGKEQFASEKAGRERFPPTVSGPDAVYATINDTVTIRINASDPNNGSLVFRLGDDVPSNVDLAVDGNVATISWQVTSDEPFNLKVDVYGSDNTSAQYWPVVYMCSCLNGGNCDSSNDPDPSTAGGESKFVQRSCTCAAGYTGDSCEEDINACLLNFDPCFPGVECVDLPPPADDGMDGFRCGDCPSGYTGDGFDCQDLDECATSAVDVCDHTCENYPGTFICVCDDGFELAEDEVSCEDIDECALQLNNCSQQCVNTEGSFNCACQDGFTLASNGEDCEPDNPCSGGNDTGCDPEFGWCITNGHGNAECVCRSGYELSSDNVTCQDYDECSAGDHHCSQLCNNTIGAYSCYCEEGYEPDEDNAHLCWDIDECYQETDNCTEHEVCVNDPGSFHCNCSENAVLVGDVCVPVTTTPLVTTRTTTQSTTDQTTQSSTTKEPTTTTITTTVPPTTQSSTTKEPTTTTTTTTVPTTQSSTTKEPTTTRTATVLPTTTKTQSTTQTTTTTSQPPVTTSTLLSTRPSTTTVHSSSVSSPQTTTTTVSTTTSSTLTTHKPPTTTLTTVTPPTTPSATTTTGTKPSTTVTSEHPTTTSTSTVMTSAAVPPSTVTTTLATTTTSAPQTTKTTTRVPPTTSVKATTSPQTTKSTTTLPPTTSQKATTAKTTPQSKTTRSITVTSPPKTTPTIKQDKVTTATTTITAHSATTKLSTPMDPTALRPHEENALVLFITMLMEEFTAEVRMNFKHRVAEIVSSYCQRLVRELPECLWDDEDGEDDDDDRTKRSSNAVVFNTNDVHIPPGYPHDSTTQHGIVLAFFIIYPDSTEDFQPFPVNTIQLALQRSQMQLQQALGSKPITSMVTYPQYLYGNPPYGTTPHGTTTSPSPSTSTSGEGRPPGGRPEEHKFPLIPVVATAAVFALIALVIAVISLTKKKNSHPIAVYRVPGQDPPPYSPSRDVPCDDSVRRLKAKEVWGVDNPIIIRDSKV